jgi:hypothetical protein
MKKYFENTSNSPMYVHGTMVPPGEGVLVDMPGNDEAAAPAAAPTLAEQVALLLMASVANILKDLAHLSDDTLVMLATLEGQAETPRKTLLAAIGTEQIKRSDAVLEAAKNAAQAKALEDAQAELAGAIAALDTSVDTDDHPALEADVAAARAKVAALSPVVQA